MSKSQTYVVFAPISDANLPAFRTICRRRGTTTEELAGEILRDFIQREKAKSCGRAAGAEHVLAEGTPSVS